MFVNAGVQTNALDKLIRVQKVNANVVKMMNALIHQNVLMDNAKTVSRPKFFKNFQGRISLIALMISYTFSNSSYL